MELSVLQKKNPRLPLFAVTGPEFAPYGRVLSLPCADLLARMEAIPLPPDGSQYLASCPELEASPDAPAIREAGFGGTAAEIGFCWGHSDTLNALEWHACNEINVAGSDLVLLLAHRWDIGEDGWLDAARVRGFFLPRGTVVEVYATSLHFCPCQVSDAGFRCLVGLTEGTNTPLAAPSADPLLFRRNKWLIAHEENAALRARGAVAGIRGENFRLQY